MRRHRDRFIQVLPTADAGGMQKGCPVKLELDILIVHQLACNLYFTISMSAKTQSIYISLLQHICSLCDTT